jgi:hypothetical protein
MSRRHLIVRVETMVLFAIDLPHKKMFIEHVHGWTLETLKVLLVVHLFRFVTIVDCTGKLVSRI